MSHGSCMTSTSHIDETTTGATREKDRGLGVDQWPFQKVTARYKDKDRCKERHKKSLGQGIRRLIGRKGSHTKKPPKDKTTKA